MNKLLKILVVGMLAILPGCGNQEAPKLEDFTKGEQICHISAGRDELVLYDLDGDRQVDAIKSAGSTTLSHVADGYQDKIRSGACSKKYTQVMSPELRQRYSNLLQEIQVLEYETAKQRWEAETNSRR